MKEILRDDKPWSLVAILQKLIDSSDYLLHEKDYDKTNHEGIEIAIKHGNEIIKFIRERNNP